MLKESKMKEFLKYRAQDSQKALENMNTYELLNKNKRFTYVI